MPKIVTANQLATGTVVFLSSDGSWVTSVDDAKLYPDANAAEEGLAIGQRDAAQAIIVDPFVTDRSIGADGEATMTLRDRIRAFGPTVRFGVAQADPI